MRTLLVLAFVVTCSLLSSGQLVHKAANCSGQGASTSATNSYTFSCTANAANDAIVFFVGCGTGATAPTGVTLTASGWTITPISGFHTSGTVYSGTFAALAPNTTAATFTVTFTGGTNCLTFTNHLHDEFSGNDTTGGATTFYAHAEGNATGCAGQAVTSTNANDTVWAMCDDNLATTNWQGAGYTAGVNDLNGDGTEYKTATGSQTPTWATSSGANTTNASIVIKAAGGAAPASNLSKRKKLIKLDL